MGKDGRARLLPLHERKAPPFVFQPHRHWISWYVQVPLIISIISPHPSSFIPRPFPPFHSGNISHASSHAGTNWSPSPVDIRATPAKEIVSLRATNRGTRSSWAWSFGRLRGSQALACLAYLHDLERPTGGRRGIARFARNCIVRYYSTEHSTIPHSNEW